jgi:hypothetical protein
LFIFKHEKAALFDLPFDLPFFVGAEWNRPKKQVHFGTCSVFLGSSLCLLFTG